MLRLVRHAVTVGGRERIGRIQRVESSCPRGIDARFRRPASSESERGKLSRRHHRGARLGGRAPENAGVTRQNSKDSSFIPTRRPVRYRSGGRSLENQEGGRLPRTMAAERVSLSCERACFSPPSWPACCA
jgi:hypothetical protein